MGTNQTNLSPGYTPPEWALRPNSATLTVLTPSTVSQGNTSADGSSIQSIVPSTIYVFDATLRASHRQELTVTKNPIQTQAAITDHSYLNPAELSVDIMMTDTMQSYTAGQFTSDISRSVSAYQTIQAWQATSTLLQVSTRLRTYINMVVKSVSADETSDTLYALKCHVVFEQLLFASQVLVATSSPFVQSVSNRFQTTNQNLTGQLQLQQIPQTIDAQHNIQNSPLDVSSENTVATSGNWSSNNISSLSVGQLIRP